MDIEEDKIELKKKEVKKMFSIEEKDMKEQFLPKTSDNYSETKVHIFQRLYNLSSLKKISKLFLFIICIIIIFTNPPRKILDVLYISGCNKENLPEEYRYRILHQIDQLNAGYLEANEVYYLDLDPNIVFDYRFIILYRCPWTSKVDKAIKLAKQLNKKVFFDIDDLIIDKKYNDINPYIQKLSPKKRNSYDNNAIAIGKTLKLCEGSITTTEAMARELNNYVPEVYINHNVASEEMFKYSEIAVGQKNKKKNNDIILGYLSENNEHNDNLEVLIPSLQKIFREFKNVRFYIIGHLDIPEELKEFSSQIKIKSFTRSFRNWKDLPSLISKFDINIAPIASNIFNEAKSENKWLEASLVKVPTIASNFGVFKEVIKDGETGLLCNNSDDWYKELKNLIVNDTLKTIISENAYNYCKDNYNAVKAGFKLASIINKVANKHIGFIVPNLDLYGGIRVALKHACILKEAGWDVDIILLESRQKILDFEGEKFNVIGLNNAHLLAQYNVLVGTLYSTLYTAINYNKVERVLYLVQNYETEFTQFTDFKRTYAEKTYNIPFRVEYITISKWIEDWLKNKYNKKVKYAPNGIDLSQFKEHRRDLTKKKIRILVEGNPSKYKNVDESFKIVEKLDKNKFEIWYMTNKGKPKSWYRVNKFLRGVPFQKVSEVYSKCDILLKTSILESFSYPPLEMMATGGYNIVLPNDGNVEYLKDGYNCLFYKIGNIDSAVKAIERLVSDKNLQERLYINGLDTAKKREWKNYKEQILALYDS